MNISNNYKHLNVIVKLVNLTLNKHVFKIRNEHSFDETTPVTSLG